MRHYIQGGNPRECSAPTPPEKCDFSQEWQLANLKLPEDGVGRKIAKIPVRAGETHMCPPLLRKRIYFWGNYTESRSNGQFAQSA